MQNKDHEVQGWLTEIVGRIGYTFTHAKQRYMGDWQLSVAPHTQAQYKTLFLVRSNRHKLTFKKGFRGYTTMVSV